MAPLPLLSPRLKIPWKIDLGFEKQIHISGLSPRDKKYLLELYQIAYAMDSEKIVITQEDSKPPCDNFPLIQQLLQQIKVTLVIHQKRNIETPHSSPKVTIWKKIQSVFCSIFLST